MKSILKAGICLVLFLLATIGHLNFAFNSEQVIEPSFVAATYESQDLLLSECSPDHILAFFDSSSSGQQLSSLLYIPQILLWASWIWPPIRKRSPYRNPQRAFRLNKKRRRRLRLHLHNTLKLISPESDSLSAWPIQSTVGCA